MGRISIHLDSLEKSEIELIEEKIDKYVYFTFGAQMAIMNFELCENNEEYDVHYPPDREVKLFKLIEENELTNYMNELCLIFCQLGWEWNGRKIQYYYSKQDLEERTLHDEELRKLKSAFKNVDVSNNQNTEIFQIFFRIGSKEVKLSNWILVRDFNAFINFSGYKKYIEQEPYRKLSEKEGKRSTYKNFVQTHLYGLYNYLREETLFKDKTQKEVRRFIVEFSRLFSLDWENDILISSYSKPEIYLKDTFKKIKPS